MPSLAPHFSEMIDKSYAIARDYGHADVDVAHLLLAILTRGNDAPDVSICFEKPDEVVARVRQTLEAVPSSPATKEGPKPRHTPAFNDALYRAQQSTGRRSGLQVDIVDAFMAILEMGRTGFQDLLGEGAAFDRDLVQRLKDDDEKHTKYMKHIIPADVAKRVEFPEMPIGANAVFERFIREKNQISNIAIPLQSLAPIQVAVEGGVISRQSLSQNSSSSLRSDLARWREPIAKHINELLRDDFRRGTNHSRVRHRLIDLKSALRGSIVDVEENQFGLGYEIDRFNRLVAAYRNSPDDLPSLSAPVLDDLDYLRMQLVLGIEKLEDWRQFQEDSSSDPTRDGHADAEIVGNVLNELAEIMEYDGNNVYFDQSLPGAYRDLGSTLLQEDGVSKLTIYGAVRSGKNLISFLARTFTKIGEDAQNEFGKTLGKAAAGGLLLAFGVAALRLSWALETRWEWLKPVLELARKFVGG